MGKRPTIPLTRTGLVCVLTALGAAALAVFLVHLPPPRLRFLAESPPPLLPAAMTPLFLAIALIPLLMLLLERLLPRLPVVWRILVGVAVGLACVALPYGVLGISIRADIDPGAASSWKELLDQPIGLATLTVILLVGAALYALEQTGRRPPARVVVALVAAAVVLGAGMLWQSRLETYAWCASLFEHGWQSWLRRFPLAGLLLVISGVVAASGRLRGSPVRRTLPLRVGALLLAAIAVGLPYRHPARWRAEELEDVSFATVTKRNELVVAASRRGGVSGYYQPGALLLRRPGTGTFECLTRSALMSPIYSSYGCYGSLELKSPWSALFGPGARVRVAALDGSTSTTAFSVELPTAYGPGGPDWWRLVELGPRGSWAEGNLGRLLALGRDAWWAEQLPAHWRVGLASGRRRVLDVSDSSSPKWVAGNRLVVLVPGPTVYRGPCPCCVTREQLITVDLLSGATVRRELAYPVPVSWWHDVAPGGERFSVHAEDSSAAWLCDLDGNLEPIDPIQCDRRAQTFGCTPLLWKPGGEVSRLDEVGFRKAVEALGQSTRRLELSSFSAREVAGLAMVVQRTKGIDELVVYDLDISAGRLTPISEHVLSVEVTPDSLVMVVSGSDTRQVERFWPATGRREVLLTSAQQFAPIPFMDW